MESFYRIKQKQFPHHFIIIRSDGFNIHELYINQTYYNNQTTYFFIRGVSLCNVIPGKELSDYFFEINKKKLQYTSACELVPIIDRIAVYHPRVYRPILKSETAGSNYLNFTTNSKSLFDHTPFFDFVPYDMTSLNSGVQQLKILIDRLETIFRTIQPTESNLLSYGHEIRNLLILACTEVEAQFKGILKVNGVEKQNYTTRDFIQLAKVLKLNNYSFEIPYFPEIRPLEPFKGWNADKSTESLSWYNAYNAVKHDREGSFNQATLQNAINATAAVGILLITQYGFNIPYWKDLIGNFFELVYSPTWGFDDCYLPPMQGGSWIKKELEL